MIEDIRPEEKTEFHPRAKASMQESRRSRTWVEKVESIERMNEFSRKAREAMRRTSAKRDEGSGMG